VDDVDGTFERAIADGAAALFEPTDMPYQDRQAGITDPFGNIWWISKRLVEESYD
jgi:PhnB protein